MPKMKTDIDKYTDEQIIEKIKSDEGISTVFKGDVSEIVGGFREVCKVRDFSLDEAIKEVSCALTGHISCAVINKSGRTIRSNSININ